MRMLLKAKMPHGPFNAAVKDGSVGAKLNSILEALKPEAVYFAEFEGVRTCIMIVNLTDASQIPAYAEPWFLTFESDIEFHPCMTPDDLKRSGIDTLGKKWA